MTDIKAIKDLVNELKYNADCSFDTFTDREILKTAILTKFDLIIDFCEKIEKL